jgi:hypothetical protein
MNMQFAQNSSREGGYKHDYHIAYQPIIFNEAFMKRGWAYP